MFTAAFIFSYLVVGYLTAMAFKRWPRHNPTKDPGTLFWVWLMWPVVWIIWGIANLADFLIRIADHAGRLVK